MPRREKETRLNLWDFDDTLVASRKVAEQLYADYPDIKREEWWHDENVSTHAALLTPAISSNWSAMSSTKGEHWILTGRVLGAVLAWLEENASDPAVNGALDRLIDVVSTSGRKWKGEAEGTAARKAEFVAGICEDWEEVHLYDDTPENLEAVLELCPKVIPHLVRAGEIVDFERAPDDVELVQSSASGIK
jgi:hypothetical protein